jgi:hypothetical protein
MQTHGTTYILDGITARPLRYALSLERGLPAFTVLGLPDAETREMRERLRAALLNSGFEFPLERVVLDLSPVKLSKSVPAMSSANRKKASPISAWCGYRGTR